MSLLGQIDLNSLVVFDRLVECGSFTAAAERLGIAKARVSIQIARLEEQLGTSLFHRTTRRVTLTDAGRSLHAECQPLLQGLQDAVMQVGQDGRDAGKAVRLSGTLRLTAAVDHAVLSLAPALARFAALHPDLHIDLRASDTVADLVGEGIDVAIRLGWLRDSSLRAVKLGEFGQYLVASPDYLQRSGAPARPEELVDKEWLALSLLPTPLTWKFSAPSGETCSVQMKSRIRVNSPGALRALLRHGAGISVLDQQAASEGIRAGYLVQVLPEWSLPRGGVYAVYPPGRHVPAKVRSFIAFYRDYLDSL
ncbi:LysR family transcriptional regulator [Noviherbaspirillum sp. Root189]|uniref:LysR family transcriptional regulator n=1 Tax=Noviherbaspirillum sp. Root189 TaxID=1736487 RepID=UPI0007109929|nr:LysR family transcriptional regulator [Noviherbaspirillum sp. Root189]KRB94212.1 transcriptional regulator [Noviherbaspirillum sp. Root189]